MGNTVVVAGDRIARVRVSSCYLPLATPISDAKVLTGEWEIQMMESPPSTG